MGGEGGGYLDKRGDSLCPTDKSTNPPPPQIIHIYPYGGRGGGGGDTKTFLSLSFHYIAKFNSEILHKFLNPVLQQERRGI